MLSTAVNHGAQMVQIMKTSSTVGLELTTSQATAFSSTITPKRNPILTKLENKEVDA